MAGRATKAVRPAVRVHERITHDRPAPFDLHVAGVRVATQLLRIYFVFLVLTLTVRISGVCPLSIALLSVTLPCVAVPILAAKRIKSRERASCLARPKKT